MNIALVSAILAAAAIGATTLFLIAKRRQGSAQTLPANTAEGLRVPVTAIFFKSGGPLGSVQRNSLRPEFIIGGEGISFRAVTRKHWPFDSIAHVEARARHDRWKLIFVGKPAGNVLAVDVAGEDNAREALRALPDGLALTPEAAQLRDGNTVRAMNNLSLYTGRLR